MVYSKVFTLDHLSETQFEEYCYDLLSIVGYTNLNWRKGTGLNSSPSDNGRDIQGEFIHTLSDGEKLTEKVFVECKHYKKGVPPTEINNLLCWAMAERPNRVIIIVSNFLSNPTKEYIEKYKKNNNPPFTISYWEKPTLERLSSSSTKLLRKYNLVGTFPFLSNMNPWHIMYIHDTPINSLDYFFELLESIEKKERDRFLSFAYMVVISPHFRESITGKETLAELMVGKMDYDTFKKKCLSIDLSELFLIASIITFSLNSLFHTGDETKIIETQERIKGLVEFLKIQHKDNELNKFIVELEQSVNEVPQKTNDNYKVYDDFCNKIVAKLFDEKLTKPYTKT